MQREELARRIHAVSHLSGEFRLRSGAVSSEYFDKYLFESDPVLLHAVAEALSERVPEGAELLAGLEMGGIPIATMLSQLTGLPALFVRKKAKEYGTAKLAEGPDFRGRRLAVVEDVVTSGGQLLVSCDELRAAGAEVVGALCVIDREAGGREALRERGIELAALFTMSELKHAAGAKP